MDGARVACGLLLAVFVVTGTAGAALADEPATVRWDSATGGDRAAWHAESIDRTVTLSLTPDTPGSVSAVVSFHLPSSVRALETTVPANATVLSLDGFDRIDDTTFEWDGQTENPQITFANPANETSLGHHPVGAGEVVFADPGPWALVRVPQFETRWSYVGAELGFTSAVEIDGPGATGGEIAFLGEHDRYERATAGQSFTLIVPRAATLAATPDDILDTVENASARLDVGDRDESVFLVAAPTDVAWGVGGLQFGPDDAWVVADAPLDVPDNVWLHEYVHTRQAYETTPAAAWLTEATAEYYAAYLAYLDGGITFDEFRAHLSVGTAPRYRDVVLEDPGTWAGDGSYRKGALVVGDLDRRIRNETNGTRTFESVWTEANRNEDRLTAAAFYGHVESESTAAVREAAERYATTTDAPTVWDAETHRATFSGPVPVFEYTIGSLAVDSTYRNGTVTGPVVVGESVSVPVVVENVGDADGRFDATFTVDGVVVDFEDGSLAAGANRTVVFSFTPPVNGTYRLGIGAATTSFVAVDPATPTVVDTSVPESVRVGDSVSITVTVANEHDVPASGPIEILVDGEPVATRLVTLDVGDRTTVEATTSFDEVGPHNISVGGETTTVTVAAVTPTPTAGQPTGVPSPGFDAVAAVLALLLVSAFARSAGRV